MFPFIGGLLAVPCGAIGLLAAAHVRNINQFQTVYSFLIAPIYFLSGVFFPLTDRPILGVLVHFSPFYHGVRLLQMAAWGRVVTWRDDSSSDGAVSLHGRAGRLGVSHDSTKIDYLSSNVAGNPNLSGSSQ